jgi:MoaA/NifB/PqqE/SkfB family radical SAM enzyme
VNVAKISERSVQHGLERPNTGKLQSVWIELPGYCNLACSYCYACGGEKLEVERLLSWDDYCRLLVEAKNLGIDSVGVPGAGEPFIPSNRDLAMKFLYKCQEFGMFVTIFSTGEFISEELAEELFNLPVEIMIKGNTLKPELQDRFVSDPSRSRKIAGYGEKRNRAIEILMRQGFNNKEKCQSRFGRPSRMALVTSIMTSEHGEISNLSEIADILRFCRRNNIIFDCDTVLKRGRGASCDLCTSDQELKGKLLELQIIDREEFGNLWEISPGYVGTACDRYMHHLYINQYGEIRPCIGAMDVVLGNVRSTKLEEAWVSKEMLIIRQRKYSGECAKCGHFARGDCNSCLGRHTINLNNSNLLMKGSVETIGCWNFQH